MINIPTRLTGSKNARDSVPPSLSRFSGSPLGPRSGTAKNLRLPFSATPSNQRPEKPPNSMVSPVAVVKGAPPLVISPRSVMSKVVRLGSPWLKSLTPKGTIPSTSLVSRLRTARALFSCRVINAWEPSGALVQSGFESQSQTAPVPNLGEKPYRLINEYEKKARLWQDSPKAHGGN